MLKTQAIALLGGTPAEAAKEMRISPSAVSQWPDVLPPRLEDRVLAALARKHLPADLLREAGQASGQAAQTAAALTDNPSPIGAEPAEEQQRPTSIPPPEPSMWPLVTDRRTGERADAVAETPHVE